MLELFIVLVALALGGFFLLWLFFKILVGVVVIPIQIGVWLIKGFFGLLIAIPVAIVVLVVGSIVVPVLFAVAVPVLIVLAIPLLLLGCFVGLLKLVF